MAGEKKEINVSQHYIKSSSGFGVVATSVQSATKFRFDSESL